MDINNIFETYSNVYVLGYGSLMYADGINGRGMVHVYTDDELIPCILNGWERGMYARWGHSEFYGIVRSNDSKCNAVLSKVYTKFDLAKLSVSECTKALTGEPLNDVPGSYTLTELNISDISSKIDLPPHSIVLSYVVNKMPVEDGVAYKNYVQNVDDGIIESWGIEFHKLFLKTSTNKLL